MITYEWKIDFPLLITIMGVISSFIYTYVSNKKSKKINEWHILAGIYDDVVFLLSYPLKFQKKNTEYTNANKAVETLVKRKVIEFDLGIYQYSNFYMYDLPELCDMSKETRNKTIEIANKEFEIFFNQRISLDSLIVSPSYYSDDKEVYEKIVHIRKYVIENSKYITEKIGDLAIKAANIDPKEIMDKYKKQLEYDDKFIQENDDRFKDPYRFLILALRRRHDWLIMSLKDRIKETLRQVVHSKGKQKLRKDKWLYSGPMLI